jgi:hypothetical protein
MPGGAHDVFSSVNLDEENLPALVPVRQREAE